MAVDNRTIKELSASGLNNAVPLCIQYPRVIPGKTDEFELKSSLLHHIPKYHGLSIKDPNKHLKEFEVVCLSMTPINVDGNILKMKAFPFSLMDKAKDWLYELAPGTFTFWESMKRAFLEKFFPTSRVTLLRKWISGIQQNQGESFPTYYECFKMLVASCPQHQIKEELFIQYFYEELLPIERQMLDASARGALVDKTPVAANILIANRALNAQQYEGVGGRDPRQQQQQVNEAITLRSGKEIGTKPNTSKSSQKEDEKLLLEEEEVDKATAKVEQTLPQPPNAPKPSLSADFYVLEMEDSTHSIPLPILLGRPFMKTARTKIDMFKGTLTMEFDGEIIDFNISETIRYPKHDHSCFSIDVFDSLAEDYLDSLNEDAFETTIAQGIGLKSNLAEPIPAANTEMVAALESLPQHVGKPPIPIPIPVSTNKLLPSVIQAPILELKPLPDHLKYVFLGDKETLPVIVSSSLTAMEEEKLIRVLK
ncbi:unnamed protein product [Malus baccata var. baccata]